jgi:hypothetical protein
MKDPVTSPKLYRLQNEPGDFYTGYLTDGTQVFMGIDYPNLVAVLFDQDGKYLKSLVREISQEAHIAIKDEIMKRRASAFNKNWDESAFNKDWDELDRWAAQLGFKPGMIAVQKFNLPEYKLCIQDLPAIYGELFDQGSELDQEIKEQIQNWQKMNDYVLVWGKEYDINREGEVVST